MSLLPDNSNTRLFGHFCVSSSVDHVDWAVCKD